MKETFNIPAKKTSRKRLRSFIRRTVLKTKPPSEIKIVSLVGPEAIDVFDVYDPLGIPRENIVACELNHENAEILKLQELGITVIEGNILDYLKDTDRTFDIMNLDFCGCLNSNVVEAVKHIFYKRSIREHGVIACTFLARRENKEIKEIMNEPLYSIQESKRMSPLVESGQSMKDIPLEPKKEGDSEDINRQGIPLKIIHLGALGAKSITERAELFLMVNQDSSSNINYVRKTLKELEKKAEQLKQKNIKATYHGRTLEEHIENQYKVLNRRINDYKKADQDFLSWKGVIPTEMEFYRYSSDNGSPMMNLYFKFEYVENLYKKINLSSWGTYIFDLFNGRTMPEMQHIKTPQVPVKIDEDGEDVPKKVPHKIDEATKQKILRALRVNIPKDKIARIFGVTKMQVSALDAWRTMGKY